MSHLDIVIPLFRNAPRPDALFDSLSRMSGELAAVDASLVVAGAGRPPASIACEWIETADGLGYAGAANAGLEAARGRGHDALLLHPATQVFPGALAEMRRVAGLGPMIAFVSPRSNAGGVCALPHHRELARFLPEFQFVPSGASFCLLIAHRVLDEFGLLDEFCGDGCHQDLIMRANRCGYRAALANRAYVSYDGEERDCGPPADRYPEYEAALMQYSASATREAEEMLSALAPDSGGRRGVLFDFSSFGPCHNGTFEAGKHILRRAAAAWRGRFRIYAAAGREAARFHHLDRIAGISLVEPGSMGAYALAFRFGQPFDFEQVARMARAGVVNVYAMLDSIALDCLYLNEVELQTLWNFVFSHADAVVYNSAFTGQQFRRRFRLHPRMRELVCYHSLDPREYGGGAAEDPGSYLLVIGNSFTHKHVKPTAEALARAFPDQRIAALGLRPGEVPGVTAYPSGQLPGGQVDRLLAGARAVVFPSHYEGFGIPVLESLARRKPVLARDIPAVREVWERLGAPGNVTLYGSTRDLLARLAGGIPEWRESGRPYGPGWDESVRQLGEFFDSLLESVSSGEVLAPRLEQLRLIESYAGLLPPEDSRRRVPVRSLQVIAGLQARLRAEEERTEDMRQSLSWRVTAPLRALGAAWLKLRGQ